MNTRCSHLVLTVVAALLAASCSSSREVLVTDKRMDYRRERDVGLDLEIPPDLTRVGGGAYNLPEATPTGSATYSEFAEQRKQRGGGRSSATTSSADVLPSVDKVEVRRDGDRRWLAIQAAPDDVWFRLVDFWQQNGVLLAEQDPSTGVMRTSWLENRADIKSDFITGALRSVFDGLYSAATRDQFRVRVDRGDRPGTTELYLTHFGMEQEIKSGVTGTSEQAVWVPRPNDPDLEAEMLRRIAAHLGATDAKLQQDLAQKGGAKAPRAQLLQSSGRAQLRIDEDYARAWRSVGLTLDRVGFAVEDRDRSRGIYYVRYSDPEAGQPQKGFFSKMAFWRSDEKIDKGNRYQVRLADAGGGATVVDVLNDKGVEDTSETAVRILTLIREQLR
jgi:outer membrane protein assembly factor BamC